MKTSLFLAIFTMALIQNSYAQSSADKGGNGGNAVVCFKTPQVVRAILAQPENKRIIPDSVIKTEITSIEALDLFEARRLGGGLDGLTTPISLIATSKEESSSQFLQRMQQRLKYKLPLLASEIQNSMSQFEGKVFTGGISDETAGVSQVFDVGSMNYRLDSSKCILITVANQDGFGKTLQLSIDARLFNHPKHSELSKKTLMLHEMIYLWARTHEQKDSLLTRKVVALLIQKKFSRNAMVELIHDDFGLSELYHPERDGYFEDGSVESLVALIKTAAGQNLTSADREAAFWKASALESSARRIRNSIPYKWELFCDARYKKSGNYSEKICSEYSAEEAKAVSIEKEASLKDAQLKAITLNLKRQQLLVVMAQVRADLISKMEAISGSKCSTADLDGEVFDLINRFDAENSSTSQVFGADLIRLLKAMRCEDFQI